MKRNQSYKITFLLLSLLLPSHLLALNTDNFSEKNLPDNSPKAPNKNEKSEVKASDLIPATNQIKNSLESILLNKKATSLMFDDEQNDNIDRAIESLKNNQLFIPEDGLKNGDSDKNLTEEEKKKKAEEAKNKEDEKKSEENEKSYIYLASIIYFTPSDWVLWINDQKITSETNGKNKEIYVKAIKRDSAKLLWRMSVSKWKILSGRQSEEFAPKINKDNQVEVEFELHPNQTFILSTANVVEGRAVIALLKKREEEKKAKAAEAAKGIRKTSDEKPTQ